MANNTIRRFWNMYSMVNIEDLRGNAFQDEDGGHTFEITGLDASGNATAISGTVAAVFLRPDNTDVAIAGSVSNGKAYVTLTDECYGYPGRFGLTIFLTSGGQKVAIYAAIGTVHRTSSGAVSPETSESVVDLINEIEAAIAQIPSSYTDIMAAIAHTYSSSAVYPIGSYAWYEGELYRCTTAITSGETWNSAHWEDASLGGGSYDLKKAIDLNREKQIYTLDYLDGEATLPLQENMSSSGAAVARRMSTDFITIPGDFEVFCDKDEGVVSFNVELYNSSFTSIGDAVPNEKTKIKKIWVNTADFPNAKYAKVWVCDWANSDTDLSAAQNAYAKRHIIFRPQIKVKDAPSPEDFQQGRSEVDHSLIVDNTTRGITNVFYENTDDIYPVYNHRADLVEFYFKYYNENFEYEEDGTWNSLSLRSKEKNHPYFKIAIRRADDQSANIPTSLAQTLGGYIHFKNPIALGYTYNSSGQKMSVSRIRACEENETYVKDGYIKFKHHDYNYDLVTCDQEGGAVTAEYGWFNYSSDFGETDKAIRVQDKYIAVVFAKLNRSSEFTLEEWALLNSRYNAGELYEIVESIDPREIGNEIKNGYPEFYNAEMKATVDSAASKTGYGPVKFAMITDLHDNDHNHLSETVEKQVMAIRDLHRKIGLDFVLCGGDLTDGGYSTKSVLLDKMTEQVKMFKQIGVPVLMMRGNHDDNSYAGLSTSLVVSRNEFFARCIAPFSGKKVPSEKNYYYQDFDDVNTRVIVLDFIDYPWEVSGGNVVYHAVGGDGVWRGYSDDQIAWLLGTALNCNKRIIVTGHYSTHANLMTSWEKSIEHNYTVVSQAMIAYNSRGSVTFGGQTYSFSGKTGKVLVQVSGHSHSFGAFKDSGIVWSTTGSPSPEVTERSFDDTDYETMGTRTYGDITEAHFNAFVCDDSHIHIISFGQMGDLDFEV